MIIRRANAADNGAICNLMESVAMGKTIELVFERRPDYFLGAAIQSEDVEVYVLVDRDIVAGVFSVGHRMVYVNGESQKVRYLCDLRLHEKYRSGMQLARGYRFIYDQILSSGEVMQTLILKDNQHAVKMLTSGRAGLPTYHPCGEYLTYFLPKQKLSNKSDGLETRPATPNDVCAMNDFYQKNAKRRQFAPVIDFEKIDSSPHFQNLTVGDFIVAERAGEIVGLCALWDQTEIRRIRVMNYRLSLLRWGRTIINLFSKSSLPPMGETIPAVYLYAYTFADEVVGKQLLGAVMERMQKGQLLVAGMDRADPMNCVWEGASKRVDTGLHFLVAYKKITPPEGVFTFEVARI